MKAATRFFGTMNIMGQLKKLDLEKYPYQTITSKDNILKVTLKEKGFFKKKIIFDFTKDGEIERFKKFLDEHGDPDADTSIDYSKVKFNITD